MNSCYRRAALVFLGTCLAILSARAHDDEQPLAGHSYQGDAYDEGPRLLAESSMSDTVARVTRQHPTLSVATRIARACAN